jgi:hypothetical protein
MVRMHPDAIRLRLRIVRTVFLAVVFAALAFAALVFGFTIAALVLFAVVVVLVIYRAVREASLARTLARADRARIDQGSPAISAGFTSVSAAGILLQIVVVLAIDGLLVQNVLAHDFDRHAPVLVAIALTLLVFVIVVAALSFRLRSLQRHGMATLEQHA